MVADKTDRPCFAVERGGCVDAGVHERLFACHPPDSLPKTVVDVPMPSVGISTAGFFLLDCHLTLRLTYS